MDAAAHGGADGEALHVDALYSGRTSFEDGIVDSEQVLFGYNRENSYLTTLPEVFPCINSSTSSTVT